MVFKVLFYKLIKLYQEVLSDEIIFDWMFVWCLLHCLQVKILEVNSKFVEADIIECCKGEHENTYLSVLCPAP